MIISTRLNETGPGETSAIAEAAPDSYSVTRRDGLIIVYGPIPVNDLLTLSVHDDDQEELFMDNGLMRALGASAVIGTQEACAAEKARLRGSRLPHEDLATLTTEKQVDNWLAHGDVGASSETLALYLIGRPYQDRYGEQGALPYDAGDFERCCLLLKWAPALRERLEELQGLSPAWGRISTQWDSLEQLLAEGETVRLAGRLREIREGLLKRDIVDDFL